MANISIGCQDKARMRLALRFVCCAVAFWIVGCATAQQGYRDAELKATEASLEKTLSQVREVLKQYQSDHGVPPTKLEQIVTDGYINEIPKDPITGNADWIVVPADCPPSSNCKPGIKDIHSASNKTSTRGDPYSKW